MASAKLDLSTIEPHVATEYEVGAILEYSWGYDQTNIDYFVIVRRSESARGAWLTLVPLTTRDKQETGFMTGDCLPGVIVQGAKPFRRKLAIDNGREFGVAIRSYGWCGLWDGKPSRWSSYA